MKKATMTISFDCEKLDALTYHMGKNEDYRRTAGIATGHIDRKRRRKLQEKKQAQGHKRDDHAPQIHL